MDDVVRQVLENEHGLKIGRRIGRGGFGEVYEAQSDGGVPCAVKVSLDALDASNPAVAKEVENLNLVRAVTGHPNLVTVMDVWLIGGYLVTRWELSQEGSLQDLLHGYQEDGKSGIPVKRALMESVFKISPRRRWRRTRVKKTRNAESFTRSKAPAPPTRISADTTDYTE